MAQKDTPPTPRLGRLPTAHGHPLPTLKGHPVRHAIPHRPTPHPRQLEAWARARRLRQPRRVRLARSQLHRDHDHDQLYQLVADVVAYVETSQPFHPRDPGPLGRWVLAYQLDLIEATTPSHRWGQRHRIDDVRLGLGVDRLSPRRPW